MSKNDETIELKTKFESTSAKVAEQKDQIITLINEQKQMANNASRRVNEAKNRSTFLEEELKQTKINSQARKKVISKLRDNNDSLKN